MPQLYLNSDLYARWAADAMPTVAHGATITTIPDVSGNGRHLTTAAGTLTMNRTNPQGAPAFDFNGSTRMSFTAPTGIGAAATIITVAGRARTFQASNSRVFSMGATLLEQAIGSASHSMGFHNMTTPAYPLTGADMGGSNVRITTFVAASDASIVPYVDGVSVGTFDPANFSGATAFYVGSSALANEFFDGLIFEVLVFNVALTDQQRIAIERNLAQKYGLKYPGEAPIGIADGAGPLTAWYDFSDPSTLFTDAARTKPVATEGDSIIAVADKSPKGSHLASFVNGAGLVYKPNRFNGRGVLLTNADQYLSVSGLAAHATSTMFVVARRVGSQLGGPPGLAGHGSGCHLYDLGTSWGWRLNQAGGGPTICNGDPASLAVLVVRANSASSLDGYYNGGTPVNIDPHDEITTATTIVIGKNISGVAGVFEIGEFVRYNIAMTAAQINIVGAALATKWGTTWNTAS